MKRWLDDMVNEGRPVVVCLEVVSLIVPLEVRARLVLPKTKVHDALSGCPT